MPSYEIVEHSVEGISASPDSSIGGRHFFRVAVYFGERTKATLPDAFCEFLLAPGSDDDPMAWPLSIIEERVRRVEQDGITGDIDCFQSHELRSFKLRRAHAGHVVEQEGKKLVGKKGSVVWVQQTGESKE